MFPRLIAEYDERYDFERTERRADRHPRRRGAREIEVMERARHPADHEPRGRRQRRRRGDAAGTRKSVVEGRSEEVGVDLGGRRVNKKKKIIQYVQTRKDKPY